MASLRFCASLFLVFPLVPRVFSFTNVRRWSSCFSMSAARNSLKAELQQIRGPNKKTLPWSRKRAEPGPFPLPVIGPQRGRQIPDLQRAFNQPVVLANAGFQLNNLACFQRGNRHAVAQENAVGRDRRDTRARREDAREVQRI